MTSKPSFCNREKTERRQCRKDVGLKDDTEIQPAKGLNRIRKQGAGSRFVHGGSMPQEVVIPVLHVNIKKKQGISEISVDILNRKSRITTNNQTISFYQSEQREQKHKFVFKRQLTELNGQEIYLRKEQQIAGSNQFKKLDDIPYKISVLFDAEF